MSDEIVKSEGDGEDSGGDAGDANVKSIYRGPLAWFAMNSVAANVLMILLLVGGAAGLFTVKQEVFPSFELDMIAVQIPYPGASPEEVEEGVLLATEEAVRTISGVKEVKSTAREGIGVTTVIMERGEDIGEALNEVTARVNRITSFPADVEEPNIYRAANRWEVITVMISGDASERALRQIGERARDDLLRLDDVTFAELEGVRPYEISIEVSQENLRRYNLTLDQIAAAVRAASVDVPGGGVKTTGGEILVRTTERRYQGYQFEDIELISRPDGSSVTVGDVAVVKDDFEETDQSAVFNGKRAVFLRVFRTGDETPIQVADAVKKYVSEHEHELPPGVAMTTWFDWSDIYRQRISLLSRNALIGLVLVLLVLGLFLEVKLAFWVTLGIPISFLGAFIFLPQTDVSLNMISLFAFIQVLGMVVDDAIVVGEAVYLRRQQGTSPIRAAIEGAREVAVPVCFAIITTVCFYMPMLFIPGVMGKFFRVIPVVVITVLLLSLFESLLILPAHLAHSRPADRRGIFAFVLRRQLWFSGGLERFVDGKYRRFLGITTRYRYLTLAAALSFLIGSIGLLAGGRVEQIDMPAIDSDVVVVSARLPYGSSIERAQLVRDRLVEAAEVLFERHGGRDNVARGIYSQIGQHAMASRADFSGASAFDRGAHLVEMAIYLQPSAKRPVRSRDFAVQWRELLQDVVGLESMNFSYMSGPASGPPVHFDVSHRDPEVLREAAEAFAEELREFDGLYEINDGFEEGKQQLDFTLTPAARSVGVTELGLASQIRSAFYGAEVVRLQRGREEVKVLVRLPRAERESEYNIEQLIIQTPQGGEMPLSWAAKVKRGRAFTQINRSEGRRVLSVTASVDNAIVNEKNVVAKIKKSVVPELQARFPGLTYDEGGSAHSFGEANKSLFTGMVLAVLAVFGLLSIAFRSYVQPIIIMVAIPFGFVGAIWGHVVFGYEFSMMSTMGVIALSGVVINDSLILIVAINRNREDGMSLLDAVIAGGTRRFRPIMLTSLTTFFGLMPMLFETEVQAQFLVPMAVSLGCGVMFATAITLIIVPALYVIFDDAHRLLGRGTRRRVTVAAGAGDGETAAQPKAEGP